MFSLEDFFVLDVVFVFFLCYMGSLRTWCWVNCGRLLKSIIKAVIGMLAIDSYLSERISLHVSLRKMWGFPLATSPMEVLA